MEPSSNATPARKSEIIRNIYLYVVSLIALIMMVFALARLINLALVTWVFPQADTSPMYVGPHPPPVAPSAKDTRTPEQIAADNVSAQKQWEEDQARAEKERIAQKYRDLVQNISFLIVSAPLFWYHWRVIREDRKKLHI